MAHYREDIIDIELNSGSLHRSFASHAIGLGDNMENRYGVRLFRNGEEESIGSATCQGLFMAPNGQNILISGSEYTDVSGNRAWVQLPEACYNYEGRFALAIKLIGGGVTGTMRIIDGMVDNTGAQGAIAPTESVPTYQEILSVYDEMVEALEKMPFTTQMISANATNIPNSGLMFFKASGLRENARINENGEIVSGTGSGNNWAYEDYIPVPRGKTIYFQTAQDFTYNAHFYDADLNYIGRAASNVEFSDMFNRTYQNANAAYVRFCAYISTGYSSAYTPFIFAYTSDDDILGIPVHGWPHTDKTFTYGMTIAHSAVAMKYDVPVEYGTDDASVKIGAIQYDEDANIVSITGNNDGNKYFSIASGVKHRLVFRYPDYGVINMSTFPLEKIWIRKGEGLLGHFSMGAGPCYLAPNKNRYGNIDIAIADVDTLIHYGNGDQWSGIIMTLEFYDNDNEVVTDGWYSKNFDVLIPKGTHYRVNFGKSGNVETGDETYRKVSFIKLRDQYQTHFRGLEEQLGIIRNRIAALEGVSVPDYYASHIESKAATIEGLYSNLTAGDQFIFITDTHINGYGGNTRNSKSLMDYLLNRTHLHKVFNGGDLLNTYGLRNELNYGKMKELLREMLIAQTPDAPCGYYQLLGNHDTGRDYSGSSECGPFVNEKELFDISGQGVLHPYAVRDLWSKGWNYYFDDNERKIRYVCMNGALGSFGVGGEYNIDSLMFVGEALLSTPAGYTIVTMNHVILNNSGTAHPQFVQDVMAMFDAYNSRGTYTNGNYTMDFSNAAGEKVACLIGGHSHYDWDSTSEGGIPVIITTTDNRGGSEVPSERTAGTVNEQAFDVFTIDTENKTIKATRIGWGSDRTWSYDEV